MNKVKIVFMHIFIAIISLISIFPFAWMIISATNKSVDVSKGKLTLGTALIDNIKKLFETTDFVHAFGNSLIISIITTVLAMIVCSAAGYGFVMYRNKIKDRIFNVLLLSMMIPFAAILIPLYRFFGKLNLLNSFTAVILPSIATAFLIFFFRQNTKSFPKELLEAGRVDGVSEVNLFFRIYMPTMKSTYAAAAIITFMTAWNNYLWPLIALKDNSKKTLPLVIATLNSSYTPDYGLIMMAVVLSTIPTTLIFFLMQKNFVEGMLGSVK